MDGHASLGAFSSGFCSSRSDETTSRRKLRVQFERREHMRNARLAEIQRLSYEEYLLTPEWQHTRKRALKQAGYRCQMCHGEHIHLDVHHRTDENLGREKPEDLIVLCESCYARLQPSEPEEVPAISFGQKMTVFGVSAGIATIGIEGILHAPPPLEIAAL